MQLNLHLLTAIILLFFRTLTKTSRKSLKYYISAISVIQPTFNPLFSIDVYNCIHITYVPTLIIE